MTRKEIVKKYLIKTIQQSTLKEVKFEADGINGSLVVDCDLPFVPGKKKLIIIYE